MKRNLNILLAACFALVMLQCKNGTTTTTATGEEQQTPSAGEAILFTGNIAKAENLQIYVDKFVPISNTSLGLGNITADAQGNFQYDLPKEAGIYRLRVGGKNFLLPLDGTESKVELKADLSAGGEFDYTLQGTTAADGLPALIKEAGAGQLNAGNFLAKTAPLHPMAAMLAADKALASQPASENLLEIHKEVSKKLPSGTDYSAAYNDLLNRMTADLGNPIQLGRVAPDVKMAGPDGKEYALSDLKGKVVLLDFWASWCRPCRAANPKVVELYNKYNKKGFEVFSVSLDNPGGDQKWRDAIKADKLAWPYHVSDLQGWQSAVGKTYGVSSIPKTFLLDKEGRFVLMDANPLADIKGLEDNIKKLL
jgi:thiol-disulfide isomerase/thioredoxin